MSARRVATMERSFRSCAVLIIFMMLVPMAARAGGPFGIDHTVPLDNSGIWARHHQKVLEGATILTVVGGSLALGDRDKLGDTFWRGRSAPAWAFGPHVATRH